MEYITEPCENCGAVDTPENEVTLGPCPYDLGANSEMTMVWLCDNCSQSRADDI